MSMANSQTRINLNGDGGGMPIRLLWIKVQFLVVKKVKIWIQVQGQYLNSLFWKKFTNSHQNIWGGDVNTILHVYNTVVDVALSYQEKLPIGRKCLDDIAIFLREHEHNLNAFTVLCKMQVQSAIEKLSWVQCKLFFFNILSITFLIPLQNLEGGTMRWLQLW